MQTSTFFHGSLDYQAAQQSIGDIKPGEWLFARTEMGVRIAQLLTCAGGTRSFKQAE